MRFEKRLAASASLAWWLALLAFVAFLPPWLLLGPVAAAAAGIALYAAALGLARPAPLREAWLYLRALA